MARLWLGLAALALATSGCEATGVFSCDRDEQCSAGGRCEPEGFCSFTDEGCESGRRYDEFADESLAGLCVDAIEPSACVSSIEVGEVNACALLDSDTPVCWGASEADQLTGDAAEAQAEPLELSALSARAVALGTQHTCLRMADDAVRCFGDNANGQLGDGSTSSSPTPISPEGLERSTALVAGEKFTCAIDTEDNRGVFCWGRNVEGQIGDGSAVDQHSPVRVQRAAGGDLVGATAITAGRRHACAIANGELLCWGDNDKGQLGDDSIMRRPRAVVVPLADVVSVKAGRRHTCAVVSDGRLFCWGDNDKGQVGDGSGSGIRMSPTLIDGVSGSDLSLALGNEHSCALAGGELHCWGRNDEGQVANPAGGEITSPRSIDDLGAPLQVAVGGDTTCALGGDVLRCRGRNERGQLGIGVVDLTPHPEPATVAIDCP